MLNRIFLMLCLAPTFTGHSQQLIAREANKNTSCLFDFLVAADREKCLSHDLFFSHSCNKQDQGINVIVTSSMVNGNHHASSLLNLFDSVIKDDRNWYRQNFQVDNFMVPATSSMHYPHFRTSASIHQTDYAIATTSSLPFEERTVFIDHARLLTTRPKPLISQEEAAVTNQLDVSRQTFYDNDQNLWLDLNRLSTYTKGPSIVLHALETTENNVNSFIGIEQSSGNLFGMSTTNGQGILGWQEGNTGNLILSAASITTTGTLYSSRLIGSGEGIFVSKNEGNWESLPSDRLAYFLSDTKQSVIEIVNSSHSESSFAGIYLTQGNSTNIFGAYSSYTLTGNLRYESLVIESSTANGMLFNALQQDASYTGGIYFAINSNFIGGFLPEGSFNIGSSLSEPSAIVNISSEEKGFMPPRMSTRARKNIRSPKPGLMVYDLDLHKLCLYTKNRWEIIRSH